MLSIGISGLRKVDFTHLSVFHHERLDFSLSNTVNIQRCMFAYHFAKKFVANKSVADIGCAAGYGTSLLASDAESVTGIDFCEKTIANARDNYGHHPKMAFATSKVPPICLPESSMDVVVCFQLIEHIEDQVELLKQVYKVLKPGGTFICTTPNAAKSIARNPFHTHEYSLEEMNSDAQKVFDSFTLMGLKGNHKIKKYYEDNSNLVSSILFWDFLKLHKLLPANWLVKPYNLLSSLVRYQLLLLNEESTQTNINDFYLSTDDIDNSLDIYLIAHKN